MMSVRPMVVYLRVSTLKQGRSGLGLEAQRASVADYLAGFACRIVAEFVEIESGKVDARPELLSALAQCELSGATLVVAKLDRLSRNVAFLATLQDSGTRFVAADMPEANELTIHILAAVAQAERKTVSRRTKDALRAAKARGVVLGGKRGNESDLRKGPAASAIVRARTADRRAIKVMAQISQLREAGATSLRQIALALNSREIRAPRGGVWRASQVLGVVKRASAVQARFEY